MAFLCLNVFGQTKEINLQGAWKLAVNQEIDNGKIVPHFPGRESIEQVKIWSGNQVMFVGRTKTNTKTNEDYGLGTFKIKGDKYEEYFTIFSYKDSERKTLKMKMEMKNDTLVQTYLLNEKLESDSNTTHIEKYIRIK
jgi:hypothetical protein